MRLRMFERKPVYRETAKEYQKAGKKDKEAILEHFMLITGLKNRNYAARLLRTHGNSVRLGKKSYAKADIAKTGKRPGRGKKYDEEFKNVLFSTWETMDYICGKRLKPVLGQVVGNLSEHGHLHVSQEVMEKMLSVSASTIDRLLKADRKRLEIKGRSGTSPNSLLKRDIETRTWHDWNENCPGFMEIDLVGHEGGNSRGDFAQTLNFVDVYSGWTESIAVKNKAAKWVKEGIEEIKDRLPFDLRGIDSDTGAEFINRPLRDWCEAENIKFTRGRSSRSNDNCYVEQKNYSIVRKHVGYWRYDTDEERCLLNQLYALLRLYTNFFQPVMKMTAKERLGSKVKKKHDDIKTPYQRLLESSALTDVQKDNLRGIYNNLDLSRMKHEIDGCKKKLWYIHTNKNKTRETWGYSI